MNEFWSVQRACHEDVSNPKAFNAQPWPDSFTPTLWRRCSKLSPGWRMCRRQPECAQAWGPLIQSSNTLTLLPKSSQVKLHP